MRRKFICGNWKMYKTAPEARAFMGELNPLAAGIDDIDIGVAAPATALYAAMEAARGGPVLVGGQNLHWESEGAYTGEISAGMLLDLGCAFSLVGHSERRQYFGETDGTVLKRAGKAVASGLKAVVCIGETLAERDAGREFEIVEKQLADGVIPLGREAFAGIVIAYEPVWAIGTGRTASAEEAQRMHGRIREILKKSLGCETAEAVRILYGGSVKPSNAREILEMPDIDGALVGGASLDAKTFASIFRFRV